jgi:hypothetical protein
MIILVLSLSGCTNGANPSGSSDETGQKKIVGYVNAESIYLVNVETRVKFVVDKARSKYGIFYQPSLDDLFFFRFISINREIRKMGLNQPGVYIDRKELEEFALELMNDKLNLIYSRFNEGAGIDEIVEEFDLDSPKAPQEIIKGKIPEWDMVLWETENGDISKPSVSIRDKRVYFFKVYDKGADDDGAEWVKTTILYFPIPFSTANRIIENKMSEEWNVRINDGFYKSLIMYFSDNVPDACKTLEKYLKKKGKRDFFAFYFMARIISKKLEHSQDDALLEDIKRNLQKSVDICDDAGINPLLRNELADVMVKSGENDKALEQLRLALDKLSGNIELTRELARKFDTLGDDEYTAIAKSKIDLLEDQIKSEVMSGSRHVERSSRVKTGEGFMQEDIDELIEEVTEARKTELELDFSNLD